MRRSVLLLGALLVWGAFMSAAARFQLPATAQDIAINKAPGVAMQFTRSPQCVVALLGQRETEPGTSNWRAMRQQQFLDFIFILLYWMTFFFLIGGALRHLTAGVARKLGWLMGIFITLGAGADIGENVAILGALSGTHQGILWPFYFTVVKWISIFLALAFSVPLFLFFPKFGDLPLPNPLSRWVARTLGIIFATSAVSGVAGVIAAVVHSDAVVLLFGAVLLMFFALLLLLLEGSGLLRSIWLNFVSWSTYLYLLRVALLACAFLVLFPMLDLHSDSFASVSRGILSLETHLQFIFAGWLITGACWVAMITSRMILAYGKERVDVAPPPELAVTDKMSWLTVALWTLPGWPLLLRVLVLADFNRPVHPSVLALMGDLATGVAISLAVLYFAEWIHLHEKNPATPLTHALVLPISPGLQAAYQAQPFSQQTRLRRLFARLGPGYFDGQGYLHSGHSLAFAFFAILLVFYALGYLVLFPRAAGDNNYFPVLCYVLVLVMMAAWGGTGLSFFGDRYRFPLLTLVFVYSVIFNALLGFTPFDSDHYYVVHPISAASGEPAAHSQMAAPQAPDPAGMARRWQAQHANDNVPLVVVTATGGGIQASAWTAKVLNQLQAELQKSGCQKDFGKSVVLISSVSGGSVGSMYFAEHLAEENDPSFVAPVAASCGQFSVEDAARSSSLREAAWGLAYPDLFRTLLPVFAKKTLDRGWAVEQAWKRCWPGAPHTLGNWTTELEKGNMPAVILNSTTADSGQRFLLTNFRTPAQLPAPEGDAPELTSAPSFNNLYPKYDVDLVTAARLSATFTYVTPMSKAIPDPKQPNSELWPAHRPAFHLADGGYYDNYGVTSALEWLLDAFPKDPSSKAALQQKQAAQATSQKDRELLFIEIEASPNTKADSPQETERERAAKQPWDWTTQLTAPVTTMLNVRSSGQAEHNELGLKMLSDHPPAGLSFHRVIFAFHDAHPPLSWHLTNSQKEAIDNNWKEYQQPKLMEVKTAFGCK